jgi:ABC-type sugar transport system substrate-binding protein
MQAPCDPPDPGGRPRGLPRRELLQRGLLLGGGAVLAPSLIAACSSSSSSSASSSGSATATGSASAHITPQPTSTALSAYQKFNPNVPGGPPTSLPKKVATNFPAGSAYFQEAQNNVEKAVKERGFEFVATTWQSTDLTGNINQINSLIQSGVGAIFFQVQDEHGQAATVQNAINQGICALYEVVGPSNCQIIAVQFQTGYVQGTEAATWIKQNLGGNAKVVVFNANQIAQSLIPRAQGRIAGVKTAGPGVQIVANVGIRQLTAEEGQRLANTVIQAHPDANVWLGDDDTSIGVVAALEAAGKKPTDKIYVSGFNGQANALAAVKQGGLFRATISFPNAVYEYASGQVMCDWIEGKSIPQIMNLGIFPVTPANVDAFIAEESDPATAYKTGIAKYVEYLGNTSYYSRKYIPGSVTT